MQTVASPKVNLSGKWTEGAYRITQVMCMRPHILFARCALNRFHPTFSGEPQLTSPDDLKYTASHEWVRNNADGTITVGITLHAQDALGELVYVELPDAGRTLNQGEACAVVESTKAASDVYAPMAGEVIAVNDALADEPQKVNSEPYTGGWLFTLRPTNPGALAGLLNASDYDNGPGA